MAKSRQSSPRFGIKWDWWTKISAVVIAVVVVFAGYAGVVSLTRADTSNEVSQYTPPATSPTGRNAIAAFSATARDTSRPINVAVIGDSTGIQPTGWVYQFAVAAGVKYDRTTDLRFWNEETRSYNPTAEVHLGTQPQLSVYNGSAAGKNVAYSMENIGALLPADIPFDLVIINHGHNLDLFQPLAPQVAPLTDYIKATYPNAAIVVTEQNARLGLGNTWSVAIQQYAAAMRLQGFTVIDIYDVFDKQPDLNAVMRDDVHPNEQGQTLWADTVVRAFQLA